MSNQNTTKAFMSLFVALGEIDKVANMDVERAHFEADETILKYLDESGAGELADAFRKHRDEIGFWYA
jgi:hypothetical protein